MQIAEVQAAIQNCAELTECNNHTEAYIAGCELLLDSNPALEETINRAKECLAAAPVSVAIAKRLLWEGITSSAEDMLRREIPLFFHAADKADAVEGFASFLEKRKPVWKLKVSKDMPDM